MLLKQNCFCINRSYLRKIYQKHMKMYLDETKEKSENFVMNQAILSAAKSAKVNIRNVIFAKIFYDP